MNIIGSVHNLSELSARPYTLHLISELVDDLEGKLANDSKIDASSLYEHITKAWLERDVEKRHIDDAFKVTLMERLAAELWSSGRRTLTGDALRDWLGEQVENTPPLRRWAQQNTEPLDLMAHDLRTASFVARPSDRDFEFAHTSLLEYFLARHLLTAVIEDRFEAWAIARPSRESLQFLVEMLGRDHDHWTPQDSKGRFNQWRTRFVPRASELLFQLFVSRTDHPASPTLAGFNLAGASLPRLQVVGGEGGPPLNLATINLAGADLRDSLWRNCSLANADLSAANLDRSRWTSCRLTNVKVSQASAVGATFDRCALAQTELASTRSRRMYIRDASPMAASTPSPADLPFVIGRHSTSRHSALGLETERIDLFSGHYGWVLSVAWSPDGTHLASGSADETVRIWDTDTGECTAILTGHNSWARSVAWSPHGTHLASGGHDKTVRIWDTHTGECTATLTGHNDRVQSVAWSPHGTHLASGSHDETVRIWDTHTGECTATLTGHNDRVQSVAWSPDGTHLASGSDDRTVRIWDTHTGECTAILTDHNDRVRSVAWSPDGTHLASGSDDETVRIWDTHTGECTAILTDHNDRVRSVAWSPDGTHLASGSDDGAIMRMNPRTRTLDWRAVLLADGDSVTFDSDKTITSCTPGAWRCLGWLGTYPGTDTVTRLPAEWLGPLPIHTPQTTHAT
jgi:WD40 repeat protein